MIKIKIFIVLALFIELSGCIEVRKTVSVKVDNVEEGNLFNIKKEITPNSALELAQPEPDETTPMVGQGAFLLGEKTPLPKMTQVHINQICSPLFSVPLNELATVISDPYKPPPKGKDDRHQGVDFAFYRRFGRESIAGEIVQSVYGGKIAGIIEDRFPYGNALIVETVYDFLPLEAVQTLGIENHQSIYILYGHLESMEVRTMGENINPCQPLGKVGKTGNAGVEHLHLEMRIGLSGEILPSMSYYVQEATPEEREAYLRWRTSGEFIHFDPIKILDIAQ